MRTLKEIEFLLNRLNHRSADDLKGRDLDFEQWNPGDMAGRIDLVVKAAVCMANGGGGTVVFGVAGQVVGRERALSGVPPGIDLQSLKKSVHDRTDPHITPVFEEISVAEGTGRLLVMHISISGGVSRYIDLSGCGCVDRGQKMSLTDSCRRTTSVETGDSDYTAEVVPGSPESLLSPHALQRLRACAVEKNAPTDLLRLADMELVAALGLLRRGRLTRAALLLAGTERALCRHIPAYSWTFLRMKGLTRYGARDCRFQPLPESIKRLEEHIALCNPMVTVEHGNHHFKSRTYPEKALREALLNAFCHADYRRKSSIMVKVYRDRIEIDSPGGLKSGLSLRNILHHEPVPRNPLLVDALVRLRLANRNNLGLPRMFEALLLEGKQPPLLEEIGDSVRVTMHAGPLCPEFSAFIVDCGRRGRTFSLDELLIFHHLLNHLDVSVQDAAVLSQRTEKEAETLLVKLELAGFLVGRDTPRGRCWILKPELYTTLTGAQYPESGGGEIRRKSTMKKVQTALREQTLLKELGLGRRDGRNIYFD